MIQPGNCHLTVVNTSQKFDKKIGSEASKKVLKGKIFPSHPFDWQISF